MATISRRANLTDAGSETNTAGVLHAVERNQLSVNCSDITNTLVGISGETGSVA